MSLVIKYFLQTHLTLSYDKDNPFIISININKTFLNRDEILFYLEKDRLYIQNIEGIKYWSMQFKGWIELIETSKVNVDGEIKLLIKMKDKEKLESESNSLELLKSLSYFEKRIMDLEEFVNLNIKNETFNSSSKNQVKKNLTNILWIMLFFILIR